MVGVARIELATPAMSTQCSTTELHAHAARHVASALSPCNPEGSQLSHQRRNGQNAVFPFSSGVESKAPSPQFCRVKEATQSAVGANVVVRANVSSLSLLHIRAW